MHVKANLFIITRLENMSVSRHVNKVNVNVVYSGPALSFEITPLQAEETNTVKPLLSGHPRGKSIGP